MEEKSPAFEQTFNYYLDQLKEIDFRMLADRMNTELSGGSIPVNLFGRKYFVSGGGIEAEDGSEVIHAEKVVLCKYLLLYPETAPATDGEWLSYKSFRDGAPFVGGFRTNAELPLIRTFTGKPDQLEKCCDAAGGEIPDIELNYELIRMFYALPEVPLLLLFNDEDEEFPAEALILFRDTADSYLDMECLAMIGWLLSDHIHRAHGADDFSIM